MKNGKKLLKGASLVYIAQATIMFYSVPYFSIIYFIFGILLLSYSLLSLDELKNKKNQLLICAILSLVFNMLAGILLFISFSEISSAKTDKSNSPPEIISEERKRLDILLKLGLGMIFTSGVLFATTTWSIMSNLVKVILLIIAGALLLALSNFSEKKIKIESTTKAYYFLGLTFMLLSWIGIGYFGIGEWFSYTGEGSNLVYAITFILLSAFLYIYYKKFGEKEFLSASYISIYLLQYNTFQFIFKNTEMTLLLLAVTNLISNMFARKNNKIFAEIDSMTCYLFVPLIISYIINTSFTNDIYISLIGIVNIITIIVSNRNSDDNIKLVASEIYNYILMFFIVIDLRIEFTNPALIFFLVMTAYSMLIKFNKFNRNKFLQYADDIIYQIVAVSILFMEKLSLAPIANNLIIISYLLITILRMFLSKETKINFYILPFSIFFVVLEVLRTVNVEDSLIIAIITVIFMSISILSRNSNVKSYFYKALILMTLICYVTNLTDCMFIPTLITLVLSIYLLFKERNNKPYFLFYIFVLINIFSIFVINDILTIPTIYASLIVLLIFGIMTLLLNDKKYLNINYLAIVVPLYTLVNELNMTNSETTAIINNMFAMYILFVIVKLFVNNEKDLVATIGLSLIIVTRLFSEGLLSGLYVGIISIALIIYTFNKDNYKKLFYCSVVITILNIIVKLWNYWEKIPLWLYLLLIGVAIIGFVTYKELKHQEEAQNKKELPNKEVPENKNEVAVAKFCAICGAENKEKNEFCTKCGNNLIKK